MANGTPGYQYTTPDPTNIGVESNLSGYVGPYVTDLLGRGRAAASQPYTAYTGPLTAGTPEVQQQAYTGIAGLSAPTTMGAYTPTMGAYTPGSFTADLENPITVADPLGTVGEDGTMPTRQLNTVADQYMNPYLQSALQPQINEINRQKDISRMANAERLTSAGAYGGSRQAIMDAELDRNALQQVADVTGTGYATAYDKGLAQFNKEQDVQRLAQELSNKYGFDVFGAQERAGIAQRGILGEGMKADYGQFIEERDYPLKSAQYMHSLLQELPLETQQQVYAAPSAVSSGLGTAGGILGILKGIFT
jgi:hypothetical protein